jgi:hypothetical protein
MNNLKKGKECRCICWFIFLLLTSKVTNQPLKNSIHWVLLQKLIVAHLTTKLSSSAKKSKSLSCWKINIHDNGPSFEQLNSEIYKLRIKLNWVNSFILRPPSKNTCFILRLVPFFRDGITQVVQRLAAVRVVQCSYLCVGKIFYTRPELPRDPPNLLYNRHRVIYGEKQPERGVNNPPPFRAEV